MDKDYATHGLAGGHMHGKHGMKHHTIAHSHIDHHHDGSHTITHTHEDGSSHSHALQDLDQLHDNLEEHIGMPNVVEEPAAAPGMAGGAPMANVA